MRRWLLPILLLALGLGVTWPVRADIASAIQNGANELATLKEETRLFNQETLPERGLRLLAAQERARVAKGLLDDEVQPPNDKHPRVAEAKKISGDLDAAIHTAETATGPTIGDIVDKATTELNNLAAAATAAVGELTGLTPANFVAKNAEAIRKGAQADAAADRYAELDRFARQAGLKDKAKLKSLEDALAAARSAAFSVREKTAGDSSKYVSRVIRLFFFQNSEHMLHNLAGPGRTIGRVNPSRRQAAEDARDAARHAAAAANDAFTIAQTDRITAEEEVQRAAQAVIDAEAAVADAKTAEARTKETLDARQGELTKATKGRTDAEQRLNEFNTAHPPPTGAAAGQPTDGQGNTGGNPGAGGNNTPKKDPKKIEEERAALKAAVDAAKEKEGKATDRHAEAMDTHQKAQGRLTAAMTTLEGEQGKENGARNRLDKAITDLNAKAAAAVVKSLDMNRAAADLADAKADFNDVPAPLVATELPGSTDPIDRVRIQADTGGVLLLRGNEADVDAAMKLILQRDRPAAQVRALFWTIQVNGADTASASRNLRRALEDIDDEMRLAQAKVQAASASLRDAIIARYRFCLEQPDIRGRAKQPDNQGMVDPMSPPSDPDEDQPDDKALKEFFFNPQIYESLRLSDGLDNKPRGLHPMNVSTFAEAAAVLALARHDHQQAIIKQALEDIPERIGSLEADRLIRRRRLDPEDREKKRQEFIRQYKVRRAFPRLRYVFHYNDEQHPETKTPLSTDAMKRRQETDSYRDRRFVTPEQMEVMKFWAGTKPAFWLQVDGQLQIVERALAGKEKELTLDERQWLNGVLGFPKNDNRGLACYPPLQQLRDKLRGFARTLKLGGLIDPSDDGARLFQRLQYQREARVGGTFDRRARVAAMDVVLRRLMEATEQDLEEEFVGPALERVREAATRSGVTLGAVERSGVIALNRSPARNDPKATFEIQLPPKVNYLKEMKHAATLVAAVQSGALSGLLSGLEKTRPSDIEDEPGTYFVQSGNELEFTPIVGPDGQAIQMRVRYRRYNPVTTPKREKGQNVGRIEHHNIDTDVLDTNFELLEIGRFEGQTKIGENRQRRGGLPILNQIPGLQELPLIGYFTRERQGVIGRQVSLVFIQTAVYPSINDLIGLFDDSEGASLN